MKNKKVAVIAVVAFALSLGFSAGVEAATKNVRKLVGNHVREMQAMKTSKNFSNKRVLMLVDGQQKASTVEGFLTAADNALSEAQQRIIVVPLMLAEFERAKHIIVDINGTTIRQIQFNDFPPDRHRGLAGLVIDFKGDTSLPLQVMANVQAK